MNHRGIQYLVRGVSVTCCLLARASLAADGQPSTWLVLETPPAAQRLQEELIRAEQNQDWMQFLVLCQKTVQEYPTSLFEIAPGHYVDGKSLRRLLIQQLPLAGRRVYLTATQAEVEGLFRAGQGLARPGFVPPTWDRLLQYYTGAPAGTSAALELGDLAWHAGDIGLAIDWWLRGVEGARFSLATDADEIQVRLLVRLATARVFEGRFQSAREIQRVLENDFPKVNTTLAGNSGPAAEVFEKVLLSPEHVQRERDAGAVDFEPVSKLWKTPLQQQELQVPLSVASPLRHNPTCNLPQFWNHCVIIAHAGAVRVLDLGSGQPAWPTGFPDDTGVVYEPLTGAPTLIPVLPPPFRPGIVAGNRWIGAADYSARSPGQPLSGSTRLIALDLQAEGRLEWAVDLQTGLNEVSGGAGRNSRWVYSSSPVVYGDDVMIVLRSVSAEQGITMLFLDRETGEIKSIVPLKGGASLQQSQVPVDELTVVRDRLLVLLNGEWLVSVSLDQKAIQWARYFGRGAPSGLLQQSLPRLVHDSGVLFLAGADSVSALDPESGGTLWTTDRLSPVSGLVGVSDQLLLAVGTHAWGIHTTTGRTVWRAGYEDESAPLTSPVALSNQTLLWGTDEAIWVLNPQTGRLLQRLPCEQIGIRQLQSIQVQKNRLVLGEPDSLTGIEVLWQTSP